MAEGAEPLLLPADGSGVEDVLETLFVRVPAAGALAVTVNVVPWFRARLGIAGQVTTPAFATPPPVALTKLAPDGSVSLTTRLLATEGPQFVTWTR